MIIYCARNIINGKRYIGQTVCGLAKRRREHLYDAERGVKNKFYNAIRKHGAENFEWVIIDHADSIEKLNWLEENYIAGYKSRTGGYNIAFGGSNRRQPLSARKKLSEAHKGKKLSAEHKKKISEAGKGKKRPDETKQKISKAQKGCKNHSFGKQLSEEHRRKISDAGKGKKRSEETRGKISEARKGKKHSEETRKKMSGEKNHNFDPTVHAFSHPFFGDIHITKHDLSKRFLLDRSHISGLISGKQKSHKGWRMAAGGRG